MTSSDRRIVLLRHGETEWARTGRHTGRTDVPLTALGEKQSRAAGNAVEALGLRSPLVIASPFSRAQQTAHLAGLGVDRSWDALSEWDYGSYEGLSTPEIRQQVPDWTVWTHPCPHGEQSEHVHARADLVLSVAHSQLADRDVILIGHGHFSRALIARWVELPVNEGRRFALSPAAFTILGFERGVQQLLTHNVTHNVTHEEGAR